MESENEDGDAWGEATELVSLFKDRAAWPSGPWDDEPDRVEWRDEATGLPCLLVRGPSGAWCGYVGVFEGHPLHGYGAHQSCPALAARREERLAEPVGETPSIMAVLKGMTAEGLGLSPEEVFTVHWGLNFARVCSPQGGRIRLTPRKGEPHPVWWFGFDCHHSGDLAPEDLLSDWPRDGIYRTMGYARSQVTGLANQIAKVTG